LFFFLTRVFLDVDLPVPPCLLSRFFHTDYVRSSPLSLCHAFLFKMVPPPSGLAFWLASVSSFILQTFFFYFLLCDDVGHNFFVSFSPLSPARSLVPLLLPSSSKFVVVCLRSRMSFLPLFLRCFFFLSLFLSSSWMYFSLPHFFFFFCAFVSRFLVLYLVPAVQVFPFLLCPLFLFFCLLPSLWGRKVLIKFLV